MDGAKHPYDPKLPWEPISTTNEKLNYFECDFEIVSVISSKNTVEERSLSPSQIVAPRPIRKIDLPHLTTAASTFEHNSPSTSLDINRIVPRQISPDAEYSRDDGYIKEGGRNT